MSTKYFIIAEKPELRKAVQAAIRQGYNRIPPGEYSVVKSFGHLMKLKEPSDYDPKYASWSLEDLPIGFNPWEEVPILTRPGGAMGSNADALRAIDEGIQKADIIVNCGDVDDEGQYLIDQLINYYMKIPKPVKRLLVNDNSPEYIINQLCHMEDNSKYVRLGYAAQARTVADALFGFNYTRWYTLSYNAPLRIGRVKTPTLGLVVNRDREIEGHTVKKYYELTFTATDTRTGKAFTAIYTPAKDDPDLIDGKLLNPMHLDELVKKLQNATLQGMVSKKPKTIAPPLPFNLAELQSYCSVHYKLDPLAVQDNYTQSLREKALITYNRSTSRYLHEEMHADAPRVMDAIMSNMGKNYPVDTSIKSKCFNDKAANGEAHHAIIPTATKYDLNSLSKEERIVYNSIVLYYLIQFMSPCTKEVTSCTIPLENGGTLTAVSTITTDPGFLTVYPFKKPDDITPLGDLPGGGYSFTLSDPEISDHETKPPKRYTKASLIKEMTSVAKYCTDPQIKKLFLEKDDGLQSENGSIGTPATRAAIINTLIDKDKYIEEVGGVLRSTQAGRAFYDILPPDLKALDTTVKWWLITKEIKAGTAEKDALYQSVMQEIEEFLASPPKISQNTTLRQELSGKRVLIPLGKCPRCGKDVVEGKKGYGCVGYKDPENPCRFVIWKSSPFLEKSKKYVTTTMAKQMLSKGACNVSGLIGKNGNKYDGKLVLNDTGEYVNLNFEFKSEDERAVGKCPRCGRNVVENSKGYGCVGYAEDDRCGFFLSKTNPIMEKAKKTVTRKMAEKLLKDGKVHVSGLISKTGNVYNADLRLNDNGQFVRLDLEFEERSRSQRS